MINATNLIYPADIFVMAVTSGPTGPKNLQFFGQSRTNSSDPDIQLGYQTDTSPAIVSDQAISYLGARGGWGEPNNILAALYTSLGSKELNPDNLYVDIRDHTGCWNNMIARKWASHATWHATWHFMKPISIPDPHEAKRNELWSAWGDSRYFSPTNAAQAGNEHLIKYRLPTF